MTYHDACCVFVVVMHPYLQLVVELKNQVALAHQTERRIVALAEEFKAQVCRSV
jgi:hypothetical protein